MKKIEFKTSKGSFVLVDLSEVEAANYLTNVNANSIIGNIKGMTEERFAEVVDTAAFLANKVFYKNYGDFKAIDFRDIVENSFSSPRKSFESLVRSLGWYLLENPLDSTKYLFEEGKDQNKFFVRLPKRKWQEAESKTFYSPILLKKI